MTSNPLKPNDPRLRWNRSKYTIRGQKDTTTPRSACSVCYADGSITEPGPITWFACPNGHPAWSCTEKAAKDNAVFIARLYIGPP